MSKVLRFIVFFLVREVSVRGGCPPAPVDRDGAGC